MIRRATKHSTDIIQNLQSCGPRNVIILVGQILDQSKCGAVINILRAAFVTTAPATVAGGSYGEAIIDQVSPIDDVNDTVVCLQLVSEQLPVMEVIVDAIITRTSKPELQFQYDNHAELFRDRQTRANSCKSQPTESCDSIEQLNTIPWILAMIHESASHDSGS